MSNILTITSPCSYALLFVSWAFSIEVCTICWRRYIQPVHIVQRLAYPSSCLEWFNNFVSCLKPSELIADGSRDYQCAVNCEEIPVFLCADLTSAKFTVDGKNNWELAFAKGGNSLVRELHTAGLDLGNLDETVKTILHVAVEQNNEPLVLLLQSLSFDMTAHDSNGRTALDIANEANMTNMQDLLSRLRVSARMGERMG